MSKMTVARESVDFKKYEVMVFAEILEMIARVAEIKYSESGLTLQQKVE